MTQILQRKKWFGLLAWLAVSFLASAIGSFPSINAASFYGELNQPSWAPPSFVFGPVWTTLYFLMGVSAWLVWKKQGFIAARAALILFLVQLAVNALWSWLFFAWKLGALAFVDILLLWCLIGATVIAFWRIRPLAAYLLLPYWAWVTFASVLNFAVWQMNPQLLGS